LSKRGRVENSLTIDVVQLNRDGNLNPGEEWTLRWSKVGKIIASIRGQFLEDGIRLIYSLDQGEKNRKEITQFLRIDNTNCHFGGTRPWFVCPECDRRARKLHSVGGDFLCRKCQKLSYDSQNESKAYRGISEAQKIRIGLGGSPDLFLPFPEKPKGMHWNTYYRMRAKGQKASKGAWDWFGKYEKALLG